MHDTSSDQLIKWRNDTPGCSTTNHLNNAGAALMPKPVVDAIHTHIDLEAEIGGYEAEEATADRIANCYSSVAKLIGSAASNIAIVENATVATSQALSAFHYRHGDTIITTNVDYASNQIMLLSLAGRFGIKIVRAEELPEGGADPDSILKLIKKHRPKLVLMSWIPTNSGLIQDAKTIGRICLDEDVPFVLDACQAVGQFPIDVNELNCDYLAATARKFLRGPRGIGFLYVSDRMLNQGLAPLFPDTHGATWIAPGTYRLEPGAKQYENWEFSYALVLGLGAAADYANSIDLEMAGRRAAELAMYTRESLTSRIRGVRVLDYGKEKCAIVSADFDERDPGELVGLLREQKINTSVASRTAGVIDMTAKKATSILRISPHYYNTVDEIDKLIHCLSEIQN